MTLPGARSGSAAVASNSLWNVVAFSIGVFANLLTIPFALEHLGPEAFGTAGLVMAVVAPATIIGVALGMSVAQNLAAQTAPPREIMQSATFLGVMAAAVGFALLTLAGPVVATTLFGINPDHLPGLRLAFLAAAAGWAAAIGSAVLQAMFVARQQYVRVAQANMVGAVATALAVFVLVGRSATTASYTAALSVGFGATFASWLLISARQLGNQLGPPRPRRRTLSLLAGFGGWQLGAQAGGIVSGQADRYLLGATASPDVIAWYNVALRLEEVAYIGVLKIGEVLFPVFGTEQLSSTARRADLFVRSNWILNLVAACFLAPLLCVGDDLLRVWTDPLVAERAGDALFVFTLAGLVGCGVNTFSYYALGLGRSKLNFQMSVLTAVISVLVSLALIPTYGFAAAGVGVLCAMAVKLPVTMIVSRALFERTLGWGRMIEAIIIPLAVGAGVGWGLRYAGLPEPDGWMEMGALYALIMLTIGAAVVLAALLGPARHACLRDLGSILGFLAGRTKPRPG